MRVAGSGFGGELRANRTFSFHPCSSRKMSFFSKLLQTFTGRFKAETNASHTQSCDLLEERPNKRQKTAAHDAITASARSVPLPPSSPPNLSTMEDPMSVVLSFLGHQGMLKLEMTSKHFRNVCQVEWKRLETKIPTEALQGFDASNRSPKYRVTRFHRLSKYAKEMEQQRRLHDSEGFQCGGCNDFPDLHVRCLEAMNDYDWFIRISRSSEDSEDTGLVWEGAVATSHSTPITSNFVSLPLDPITHILLSKWPNLRAFHHHPTSFDPEGFNNTSATVVILSRRIPFLAPSLVISTSTVATGSLKKLSNEGATTSGERFQLLFEPKRLFAHERTTRGRICFDIWLDRAPNVYLSSSIKYFPESIIV